MSRPATSDLNSWTVEYNGPPRLDISLHKVFLTEGQDTTAVSIVKFSPDGKYLAAGLTNVAVIWDVASGEQVCTLDHAQPNQLTTDNYVRALCFSPDSTSLATGAEDTLIREKTYKRRIYTTLTGHELEVYTLLYTPEGLLASGSGDETIRIWDLPSNNPHPRILSVGALPSGVTCIAISPDGRHLAGSYLDNAVRIWDLTTTNPVPVQELKGYDEPVYGLVFSPDGRGLFTTSLDKMASHWDLTSGEVSVTFEGHTDFAICCTTSPDGLWLFTSSKDETIKVWDTSSGEVQATIQGHRSSVISLDVISSGEYLASGGRDAMTRLWKLKPSLAAV
ncbi:hypothetical protein CVT24_007637 [Panaeolus cyanescens]|uniref:Uncharacterized protein n=1 Tax=Panaeolus cyanescens TaxID=181874 RepID=A0A409W584_9AGAR|nr:hypothetical protein CVT24_007637 [Panaeolus cyanescens]